MSVTIPSDVVSAFWGCVITGFSALSIFFISLRSKTIPLTWGAKVSGVTKEELHEHCTKRQNSLDTKLESIYAIIQKNSDVLTDVRERIARLEGMTTADHK